MSWFWVMMGGALGSGMRFGLRELGLYLGFSSPSIILSMNIVGSFLLGILTPSLSHAHPYYILFWGVGVLGGFTTFSAFALDFVQIQSSHSIYAILYALVSVMGSILACYLGYYLR